MGERESANYGTGVAEWYDSLYGVCPPAMAGDVEFYLAAARRLGITLELGVGTGRVACRLAAGGIDVVGLDRSPYMLEQARNKASRLPSRAGARIDLVKGDMRDFNLDRRFGLVIIPFRGFQHLLTTADQQQALASIRRHLRAHGELILDLFDPTPDFISNCNGATGRKRLAHKKDGTLVSFHALGETDPGTQIYTETRHYEEVDSAGHHLRSWRERLLLRWTYKGEMEQLLALAGFQVLALYGDFRGGPFRPGGEQIWVVRRA